MKEAVRLAVIEYLADVEAREPKYRPSRKIVWRSWCCSEWAANYILDLIDKEECIEDIIDALEAFRDKMEDFRERNNRNGYIFEEAYDVAGEILDIINAMI